jgi:hypothetical protein
VKRELTGLSLNQEASQKELEGVQKMAPRRASPRRSGGSKSAAKNLSTSLGHTLKKAKIKCASIYNCLIFIDLFWELSKHTLYTNAAISIYIYRKQNYIYVYAAVSNGECKTESHAIFLNLFTVCSSCKWQFVVCQPIKTTNNVQGHGLRPLPNVSMNFRPTLVYQTQ